MKEMKPCCNVRWAWLGSVAAGIADCRADVCGFTPDQWRIIILMGLVLTPVMLITNSCGITFCCHRAWRLLLAHADDNEFEAGMIKQGSNKKEVKIIGARGGT